MTYFLSREQAARYADKKGWENFWSHSIPDSHYGRVWRVSQMPGQCPAEHWKSRNYVAHVESAYIDGGRTPGIRGVIVVTCFKHEIPPEDWVEIEAEGHTVEPITPSMWGKDDKPSKVKGTVASRARSEVESPTKLVWSIADSMPGADRKEVIAACVEQGINKSTAQTQYYRWSKAKEG